MAYVINEPCIGTKDNSCVEVCPVDCIHPTPDEPDYDKVEMLYIDPEECIDCVACVEACPVDAITPEDMVPPDWQHTSSATPPTTERATAAGAGHRAGRHEERDTLATAPSRRAGGAGGACFVLGPSRVNDHGDAKHTLSRFRSGRYPLPRHPALRNGAQRDTDKTRGEHPLSPLDTALTETARGGRDDRGSHRANR